MSECFDPDSLSVTTCGNGHTNYLGPVYRNHRAAYKTAKERAKMLRHERLMRKIMVDGFKAAEKASRGVGASSAARNS